MNMSHHHFFLKLGFLPVFLSVLFSCSNPGSSCADHKVYVRTVYSDGTAEEDTVCFTGTDGGMEFRIEKDRLENVDTISVTPDFAIAHAGEDGFFLLPEGIATYFLENRPDVTRRIFRRHPLAMVGICTPRGCFMEVLKTYRFDMAVSTIHKGGEYRNTLDYVFKGVAPKHDLVLEVYELKGDEATYSGMGRLYRKLFVEDRLVPLKDKAAARPLLKYAVDNPEIRIRQAWKPVPTPEPDQTPENEPAVRVKVTFDRVCDIVDALKDAGVPGAQLTLVGWNLKGHDGRFPTVFPPESTLGGEPRLKHLISYAQQKGFQIVPHICTGDSYRISEDFDENDLAANPDGAIVQEAVYGAGRMYKLCNKVAYGKFVQPINDSLKAYGFKGLEYNDVYSIIPPVTCSNPAHPLDTDESIGYVRKILADGIEKIGGIASEGGYDFVADILDFALYVSMNSNFSFDRLKDDYFPVWHIAYNGYIFSCPFSQSVNYPVKAPEFAMKIQEYGCHPTFYFYSAHRDDSQNWIGSATRDLFCGTDVELDASVKAIKQGYDYLQQYGYIQYLTMDDHCKLADKVYRTTFSDGTVTICNYSDREFDYQGHIVGAADWLTIK